MQNRDQDATCKKSLQTKGFRVQRAYARVLREHALQRKCLTASDGSCLIVRYFFITWESVAPLNTFELLDRVAVDAMLQVVQPAQKRGPHKVSASSAYEEFLNKSGGTATRQPPPRGHSPITAGPS
jgi:hypothetical protein